LADDVTGKKEFVMPKVAIEKRKGAPPVKVKRSKAPDLISLIGLKVAETCELIALIKKGLEYSSVEHFIRKANLQRDEAIDLVGISARTLVRRKEKGRLSPDESDRLVRAARIVSGAQQLFEGDAAAANRWLKTSQPALGGATPMEYAGTETGAREVEALINRLEYGIFS
jgi:putative toxin-antitoxin system antitoxin component (TIGR02293 family)